MKVTFIPSLSRSVTALCALHNNNNNNNNNINPFHGGSSSSSSSNSNSGNNINNMNNPLSPANLLASRLHMIRPSSASNTESNNDCTSSIMTSSTSSDSLSSVFIDSCVSELCHIVPPLQDNYKRIYLVRHGQTEWNVQNKIQGSTYDIDLNSNGIYQAQTVGDLLSSLPDYNKIDLIVSSNLERAEQTANIITRTIQDKQKLMSYDTFSSSSRSRLSVSPLWRSSSSSSNGQTKLYPIKRVLMNKFSEMKFGKEFEGLSLQNKQETKVKKYYAYEQLMKNFPSMKYPQGGESIYDVQQRGILGIQQILHDFPNSSHIVIVSHGRFNKILLSMITDTNVHNNNNDHKEQQQQQTEIEQDNSCINIIDIHETDVTQCKLHVLNYNEHLNEWQ